MQAQRVAKSESSRVPSGSQAGVIILRQEPFNAETPLTEQIGLLTPNPIFYVRTHFPIPHLDVATWRLEVGGDVERPIQLTFDELRSLPSRSILVTLECAGNGRRFLHPAVGGEQWGYGAVSTAEWTGVPLGEVLAKAGLTDRVRDVVIAGADEGNVTDVDQIIPFARCLELDAALHPDTLLAYAMNGSLLPIEHGFPVRLIVPGWYGMASVKWVNRITATARPAPLYFQDEEYVIAHSERGDTAKTPLTATRVRSLILTPMSGQKLSSGLPQVIRGLAWSGAAPIARVEVSVDGGRSWETATFASDPERYAWRRWECQWNARSVGLVILCNRAFDTDGHTQPCQSEWNTLGYANNAIQRVRVQVI
jgi:DMSO/TMAO reductase YedYZ molybdopterin-dependent catalytic subunit